MASTATGPASSSEDGSPRSVLVGVDTGGTFTDVILSDATGRVTAHKSPTTMPDPSDGFVRGIRKAGVSGSEIDSITHGTTIGLNAIITRRGAKVGLVHTEGFRDLLDTGRAWRPVEATVDPRYRRPHEERPIVRRNLRRPVKERMMADGTVLFPFDEEARQDLLVKVREMVDAGVESVAVCLLHSYKFPEHEREIQALIASEFPDLPVDISSDTCPYPKEYGRTMTTVLNAYIRPITERYITQLRDKLSADGYTNPIWIATNQGGMTTDEVSKTKPVLTLGSGPVGGVLAAKRYSELLDLPNLITFDLGGTSADVSILTGGQTVMARELVFEHDIITTLPVIEVSSIGAGGSSIAWLDPAGGIHVGPQSAGGDPGPACYGKGGEEPTVTDAWLLQNILDAEQSLGGEIELRPDRAEAAMARVAEPLGVDAAEAARVIGQVANSNMAELIRRMTIYRGLDPRDYTLLAFGAAGPVPAGAIARDLGVGQVVVPGLAGGFSAYGLAQADFTTEETAPIMSMLDSVDDARLREVFGELAEKALRTVEQHDMRRDESSLALSFDGMYLGQSWELTAPIAQLPESGVREALVESFHATHELLRGYRIEDMGIRILTARVVAYGQRARAGLQEIEAGGAEPPAEALIGHREVDFPGGAARTACYRREALQSGNEIAGPAVLHDENFTVLVSPGDTCRVDAHGNCWLTIGN
ncbi:MAG: N-methylhydantoinase [Thermoleophilaceae bacterium]|nr:N-methylhydantoinase [Solirubrobacteraceae bacterium]MEA2402771.1 N-methylhydantoinase [Thermoleophilaceae bacterium]